MKMYSSRKKAKNIVLDQLTCLLSFRREESPGPPTRKLLATSIIHS